MAAIIGPAARRRAQRDNLALLLALGGSAIPAAGAALYSGVTPTAGDGLTLGAITSYDTIPVLMLVGALAIVVLGDEQRTGPASAPARAAALVTAIGGLLLGLAYLRGAYVLRSGGAWSVDSDGQPVGWTLLRITNVASFIVTGVVCLTSAALAGRWTIEQKRSTS